MALKRIFIGWNRPLCTTVPEYLLSYSAADLPDLRGTFVVVPTRQSSWRLRAALPCKADARGLALLGPEIVTPPVLIAPPKRAGLASELDRLLAWIRVLKNVPPGACCAFLGAHEKRKFSTDWALQIADQLQNLRQELADGGLTIAAVSKSAVPLEEEERWSDMAELEHRYLDALAEAGLQDTSHCKLRHAETSAPPEGVNRIVLAAVPDPPKLLLTHLQRWAGAGCEIDILIAAPEIESDAFDEWGRALPEAWQKRHIVLSNDNIWLQATPEDTANRIARAIAGGLKTPGIDNLRPRLAIGVPDRETIAPLQRELAALDIPAFDPQNQPFSRTALFRLIKALLELRSATGYAKVTPLLRHPDIMKAIGSSSDILYQLDEFQSVHLPVSLDDLPTKNSGGERTALIVALSRIREWRSMLLKRPLAEALRTVLQEIYAKRMLKPDTPRDSAFQQAVTTLDSVLRELEAASAAGATNEHAQEAFLARLHAGTLKAQRGNACVDLEGWLELAWNPASLLFVAGMNEGLVPDGHLGDLFLPDTLRQQLDLRDDRLRIARDTYLLTALLEQRRRDGRVILALGKASSSGDPLRPSRLLFRCTNGELIARAQLLFQDPPASRDTAPFSTSFRLAPKEVPPACMDPKRSTQMSPTLFRSYLLCPLRFYLQQVLNMEPLDDASREPDARAFGNWVHEVLNDMALAGQSVWGCGDADQLEHFLLKKLNERTDRLYGERKWLGIELAIDSAAQRLKAFAKMQVDWFNDGWEIIEHEQTKTTRIHGLTVKGRIDRIDQNTRTGEICVLDYKTTDNAKTPEKAHIGSQRKDETLPAAVIPKTLLDRNKRSDQRWSDLQLPIYHEFATAQFPGTKILLGYVLLPNKLEESAFSIWTNYSDALHASAMACAEAVAENIRNGVFWPPGILTTPYEEDFTGLLLSDPFKTMDPPDSPWRHDK